MKKLTRKTLDELAKILPVVSIEEQKECIGGGMDSCVFNCYSYIGGMPTEYFYDTTLHMLGYEPNDNGGVPTSDIAKIGSFGGLTIEEVTKDSQFILQADGNTKDGRRVMMTFNKDGIDHAVVVTGFVKEDGITKLLYYDPTTGEKGDRKMTNYSGLYLVTKHTDSPISVSDPTGMSLDPNRSIYNG